MMDIYEEVKDFKATPKKVLALFLCVFIFIVGGIGVYLATLGRYLYDKIFSDPPEDEKIHPRPYYKGGSD